MRKQGYRPSTIRSCVNTLKAAAKKANLLEPEAVKCYLASANLSAGRKEKICQDLARLYKLKQVPFETPRYQRVDTLPFIPQESEIDQLISACGKHFGVHRLRTMTYVAVNWGSNPLPRLWSTHRLLPTCPIVGDRPCMSTYSMYH
jgi:hypothetical protein